MNELALFAGAGGGILASDLLGLRTVCAVEIDDYARSVLLARQNDGILRPFPVWDDVTTFDGRPWRGTVGLVSGGFPCTDISVARAMWGRQGINGESSGLWREYLRIIDEIEPSEVFGENSPALRSQGLDVIVRELAARGYVCRWVTIGAGDIGLPHARKRLWFYASNANNERLEGHAGHESDQGGWQNKNRPSAYAPVFRCPRCQFELEVDDKYGCPDCEAEGIDRGNRWKGLLPRVTGMGNDVAGRVDRLRAIGNGQVPAVAAIAYRILKYGE